MVHLQKCRNEYNIHLAIRSSPPSPTGPRACPCRNRRDRIDRRIRLHLSSRPTPQTSTPHASAAPIPNFDSNDPYQVLGMSMNSGHISADKREIKRVYKRLALLYHPDVVSTGIDKKTASDRFAKINWAYQTLTGKYNSDIGSSSSSSSSSQKSSSSSSQSASSNSDWQPPHRRQGGSSSTYKPNSYTSSRSGVDNDDPFNLNNNYNNNKKYDEDNYNVEGDSFGAIFRDFVTGAAVQGGGVVKDLVDFLEQNVEGYSPSPSSSSSSSSNRYSKTGQDAELRILLNTGSLRDIADEMDTTELVVQQLGEKQRRLDDELITVTADAAMATKYMEKLELEESSAELQARKTVVAGYIQKARKRLLALQTRYKELIVAGENDPVSGGGAGAVAGGSSRTVSSNSWRGTSSNPPEDAWKEETFTSFGTAQSRGSSRRRRRQQQQQQQQEQQQQQQPRQPPNTAAYQATESPTTSKTTSPGSRSTAAASPNSFFSPPISPHRRITYEQRVDDKRRLRELKVDEAFDQLKKDLGLM